MTLTLKVTEVFSRRLDDWHAIDWRRILRNVRRLQVRIVKAVKAGKWRLVRKLQHLLNHSMSGKLLAVRRVTENRGKKTPGVDGIVWDTPEKKINAVHEAMRQKRYKAQPLRRLYIPKKNGKKRPLGIPVMKDRGHQALHKLGLEPVAECLADGNSYGFRPERSAQDAAGQIFNALCRKTSAKWVLEGDIKACFDEISHEWLMKNVPMHKRTLAKWLKTGYMEREIFHHTDKGTPQGGIISPLLANLCLDGLEAAVCRHKTEGRKRMINVSRYADDFVSTGESKEWLENEVKPRAVRFFKERGLQLSEEKTRITRVTDGFDFLGWNFRKYPDGKLLIKPSKDSIKALLDKTGKIIRDNRQAKTENLINLLNPVIRGWTNYHRHSVAKRVFYHVDSVIFRQLWHWAKRRHPKKNARWVRKRYFVSKGGNNWVLSGVNQEGKRLCLRRAGDVPVTRHIKVKAQANPYDPEWDGYFEERYLWKWLNSNWGRGKLRSLWEIQEGLCPICGYGFTDETDIHVHHRMERSKGGDDCLDNLVLLHPNCHRQVHHLIDLGIYVLPPVNEKRL